MPRRFDPVQKDQLKRIRAAIDELLQALGVCPPGKGLADLTADVSSDKLMLVAQGLGWLKAAALIDEVVDGEHPGNGSGKHLP